MSCRPSSRCASSPRQESELAVSERAACIELRPDPPFGRSLFPDFCELITDGNA